MNNYEKKLMKVKIPDHIRMAAFKGVKEEFGKFSNEKLIMKALSQILLKLHDGNEELIALAEVLQGRLYK